MNIFYLNGIGLSAGDGFGDNNFVRLNFGTTKKTLKEGLKRFKKALAKIN